MGFTGVSVYMTCVFLCLVGSKVSSVMISDDKR